MKPIYDIFIERLTGKPKSNVYRIFFAWELLFHIPLIVTTFLVDQKYIFSREHLLKNEYIQQNYLNITSAHFYIYELVKLAVAAFMTYLIIYKLPAWIGFPTYKQSIDADYKNQEYKIKSDGRLQKKREELLDKEMDVADKTVELQQKQDQIAETESDHWDKEYEEYKAAANTIGDLSELEVAYFQHNGRVRPSDYNHNIKWQIDNDVLAYAVSNNLADYDKGHATIELTEKGKYFLAKLKLSK